MKVKNQNKKNKNLAFGKNLVSSLMLRNKIIVAMSGGVDSSVAAALLKKQGLDVVGVFMKFWSPANEIKIENRCCSTESEIRARKIAKIMDIHFYVFNFEKEFKKRIVDYFLQGYKAGRTPNPCVVCNKEIKFGLLIERALKLGAEFVATGHYAKKQGAGEKRQGNIYKLLKGKDKNKDQSYFLWKLNQNQLKHILFPVGNYTRQEVERMAKKFKLSFSNVKKSMEVCFVPKTIEDFLKKYVKMKPGRIINEKGMLLGQHEGLPLYTTGQRRGIKLSGGPYYVLGKDLKKNQLIVSKNEKDLYKKELTVGNVNWVSGKEPKLPLRAQVKIRYRSDSVPAVISKRLNAKRYTLKFSRPQRAITPGQSAVFYRGEELLGGGIMIN